MYTNAGTPAVARILFREFDRPVDPWDDSHHVTPQHNSRLVRARARGGHSSSAWPAFFLFLLRVSVSHLRVFTSPFVASPSSSSSSSFLPPFSFSPYAPVAPAHCHTRARAPSRGTTHARRHRPEESLKLTSLLSLPSPPVLRVAASAVISVERMELWKMLN